ncbi:MAG: YecA family protein [Salinispira sp.]
MNTDAEIKKINECLPDLYFNKAKEVIEGELEFWAAYDGKRIAINVQPQEYDNTFHVYYEIMVDLKNRDNFGLPKVYETGNKLIERATLLNIREIDLHLNSDDSCCLGIFTPVEIERFRSISNYLIGPVSSFFAWHAYWEKFDEKPPWGEYSHSHGPAEKINEWKNPGRNDLCPCGSNIKFKKCCMDKREIFMRNSNYR